MAQKYTVAGLATDRFGKTTVRYSNNIYTRLSRLKSAQFTNINMAQVKEPLSKSELCHHLLTLIQFQYDKKIRLKELDQLEEDNE